MDGETYATAEMWMMVQKARWFGDEKAAKEMLRTDDAKVHKALERKVKDFSNGIWDKSKYSAVAGRVPIWPGSLSCLHLRALRRFRRAPMPEGQ